MTHAVRGENPSAKLRRIPRPTPDSGRRRPDERYERLSLTRASLLGTGHRQVLSRYPRLVTVAIMRRWSRDRRSRPTAVSIACGSPPSDSASPRVDFETTEPPASASMRSKTTDVGDSTARRPRDGDRRRTGRAQSCGVPHTPRPKPSGGAISCPAHPLRVRVG